MTGAELAEKKGASLTAAERKKLAAEERAKHRKKLAGELAKKYRAGASIRALAEETGKSYGFVRKLLVVDAGVTLRPRGGGYRKKTSAT